MDAESRSFLIAASTRCAAAGCWFPPTARSVPGKARSAAPTPSLRCITIRNAIFAPATRAPAASRTLPTRASSPLPMTTLRSCPTRRPVDRERPRLAAGGEGTRHLPGVVLPSRPQPYPGRHGVGRHRPRGRSLDSGIHRAWRAPGDPSRPDLRKPRRHDGGEQSSPSLPDLGHRTYSRRAPGRGSQPARL